MDLPKAALAHDPSKVDRANVKAPEGREVMVDGGEACPLPDCDGMKEKRGSEGAEPLWFEHSAYSRAESSYQRWLADQRDAVAGSGGSHGDRAACHRQVLPMWVNAGTVLPDFAPAEPRLFLEPNRTAHGPTPGPAPVPKRRSRSGQPRLAPEHRKDGGAMRPPHDSANHVQAQGHAHGRGRAHNHGQAPWRRGGGQRGRGHRWPRKRWCSEGDGGLSPWQHHGPPPKMSSVQHLAQEKIWFDKSRYDEAERCFYEGVNGPSHASQTSMCAAGDQEELVARMRSLELENNSLQNVVQDLRSALLSLESRVALLERTPAAARPAQTAAAQQPKVSAPVEEDDDDDLDLFGSDEEDEEAERIREERVRQYAEKKAKKPALIAKSSILLDVKPWDDETDMARLEECVRSVQVDGLLWGSSKLVPVGYGIKKLQIQCVVEDDKVGMDMLEEEITKFEDYVQSVDVAAFNKI